MGRLDVKVLVTGSAGLIGGEVCRDLSERGHEAVPYDIIDGCDIRSVAQLGKAATGCDAIIHSAALLGNDKESPDDIFSVNLVGTFNVLQAAEQAGIKRVVNLSSVDVLGVFKGEAAPIYLPLDDDHPKNPTTAYGIAKLLGERMCETFAATKGMTIVTLRPPGVWTDEIYVWISENRKKDASFEYTPYWEYGAFIDVRDVGNAVLTALTCEAAGAQALLISAQDISTSGPTAREWSERLHPNVEWRGGGRFEAEPFLSLIDARRAEEVLGWRPRYSWVDFMNAPDP